jgi:hypothetical protein
MAMRLTHGLNIAEPNGGGTLPPFGRENSPYRHPANRVLY